MQIAWVVYGGLDQPTGGYIYDRLVVERLRARGDDVRVVSIEPARFAVAGGLALGGRLARLAPDAVVGDELCFRELGPAFAVLPPRTARVLLVHHLTSWELRAGFARVRVALRERLALHASDAIVATSRTTAARLGREHRLRRVDVAVPGADRLVRRPRAKASADDPVRLLFVGSWIARKRLVPLIEAFARIDGARAALAIAGDASRDPAYAGAVHRAIAAASPPAHIDVLGVLDDAQLERALAAADALVLPSEMEGYGMVLTEAIHAGVPVIAARAGAIPEVVRHGREALLFEGDAQITTALRTFLADPALRVRMRASAEARAADLPTWDAAAQSIRAAITVARRARGPRRARDA
jgi:glycosyltransferase involved in cell wall biosynthesis